MKKPNQIGQAIQRLILGGGSYVAYLKSQRELRADCETRHKRIEELKKQTLTSENNFDCNGCA